MSTKAQVKANRQNARKSTGPKTDQGKTVVLVTHNSAIAGMGDRLVRVGSGVIESADDNPHPLAAEEITW